MHKMKVRFLASHMNPSGSNRNIISIAWRLAQLGYDVDIQVVNKSRLPVMWARTHGLRIGIFDGLVDNDITYISSGLSALDIMLSFENLDRCYNYVQGYESLDYSDGTNDRVDNDRILLDGKSVATIAISDRVADWLKDLYGYSKVSVIGGSIEKEDFYVEEWFPHTTKRRVVITGQYSETARKTRDIEYLSFRATRDMDLEIFHVSIENSIFSMMADSFWISPRTEWMRRIFSSCDFAVNSTVYDACSTLDMEYLACGIPVVRAITPGFGGRLLKNGYNALISSYGDVDALRDNVRALVKDKELVSRLSNNGLKTIQQLPDWDEIVVIWDRLLASK